MNKRYIDHFFASIKILDDFEKSDLKEIDLSDLVDKKSFREKLERIIDNKRDEKRVKDLIIELRVAREFLALENLSLIRFEENPDIVVTVANIEYGIEVKRFRYRDQDIEDERKLKECSSLKLEQYGDPAKAQDQVEKVILKAIKKYRKPYPLFVYVWSDSDHQVEDLEMEFAAKSVLKDRESLAGVFCKSIYHGGCPTKLIYKDKQLAEMISPYNAECSLRFPI